MRTGVLLFCAAAVSVSGCSLSPRLDPRGYIEKTAASDGFVAQVDRAGAFALQTYRRPGASGAESKPLRVYIEGDGFAYRSRSRPSSDPTPLNPVAFELARVHASLDPEIGVLYVARPCQYVEGRDRVGCEPSVWTHGRFSERVVSAVDGAVGRAVSEGGYDGAVLIGFSGGGAVAGLVAARRGDVRALVTVAGVLDNARWTRHHGVSPLRSSLTLADELSRLSGIRQIHVFGAEDEIIPASLFDSVIGTVRSHGTVDKVVIAGADHDCCWVEHWPALVAGYNL